MAQTEVAAKITKASGPISVERNGERVELNQGDTVYATDVIYTQKSAVELVFTDGAVANLSPNSTLKIQEFSYDTGEDPAFVMSLARGAMRTLSGKLVELNPDAFKVLTPKATAGIRGTEFVTIVRLDGSEQYTLLNIDPGHNFVVTSHNGTQISLSISGGNIVISAGSDTEMSEGAITQEEALEIIKNILGDLTTDEGIAVALTNAFTQLQLDAEAQAALQEILVGALESLTAEDVNILGSDDDFDGNDDFSGEAQAPPIIVAVVDSSEGSGGDEQEIKYPVTTSGEVDFYADDDVAAVSGVVEALSHIVTITGTNEASEFVNISGDVDIIEDVSVVGGNDEIIGGHIQFTNIVGDAISVLGTLEGGDDFITLSSLTTSYLSGDILNLEDGTVTYGSDTIVITGDITNSYIFGDINNLSADADGNNDSITIVGTMSGAGAILGNGGNDTISVGSVDSADRGTDIRGGAGDDTITIGTVYITGEFSGVYGGLGADLIKITTLQSGGVSGDSGNDTITIDTFIEGGVFGEDGNDHIEVTTFNSGAIFGHDGNDTITIGNFIGGKVVGGDGEDSITAHITGGNTEIFTGSESDIDGSEDIVKLTHNGSGTVTLYGMSDGVDELYVFGERVTIESSGSIIKDGLTIVFST